MRRLMRDGGGGGRGGLEAGRVLTFRGRQSNVR